MSETRPREAARLHHVCVYCGSTNGGDPMFEAAAATLGQALARDAIGLVYGGGGRGLMGTLARAVIAGGGHVTGIIPEFLTDHDVLLREAQEHVVVRDMHTRKRLMFERADAFVALPGGIGTLEELVEQLTWVQLEQHSKPVLIADIGGFWQPLLGLLDHMRQNRFIPDTAAVRTLVTDDVTAIVPMLRAAMAEAARHGTAKTQVDRRL